MAPNMAQDEATVRRVIAQTQQQNQHREAALQHWKQQSKASDQRYDSLVAAQGQGIDKLLTGQELQTASLNGFNTRLDGFNTHLKT